MDCAGIFFDLRDAGISWQELDTPTQEMLTNGIIKKNGEIYITGLGGTILKSTDDGMNFSLVEQGHRDGFSAIIQSSDDKLFTVGEKGVDLLK